MIGESIPEAERQLVTFIPHAPESMGLAERMAWRKGYRAALKLLTPEDGMTFYWCEKHQSSSPDIDRCDYSRFKSYDGSPNECELVPCSIVTGSVD